MQSLSFLLSFLVLSLTKTAFTNPLASHVHKLEERSIADPPENPFDTGPIGSCVVPTAQQLPTCSQYIDYLVPEALLFPTVSSIREKAVYGAKKNAENREATAGDESMATGCGKTVEELECYKNFPSCADNSSTVKYVQENCENKLQQSCTEYNLLTSCRYVEEEPVKLETCNKVSSTSYDYKYCSKLQGWSTIYLTEWMNVSVINAEEDIHSFAMSGTSQQCIDMYTELKCGEAGRCWHQGTRMEINSTRELCESVLNW